MYISKEEAILGFLFFYFTDVIQASLRFHNIRAPNRCRQARYIIYKIPLIGHTNFESCNPI